MQGFLIHVGYPALILLAFLEACCIPISSEVIFGFAGVLAHQGHLSLVLVIIAGTLAELAGSCVSYEVARAAERPVIERLGRFLLITRADISRADQGRHRRRPAAPADTRVWDGWHPVRSENPDRHPERTGVTPAARSMTGNLGKSVAVGELGTA